MAIERFDESARERLSALADGELDGAEPAAICAAWSTDAAARRDWHAWHLIGDVLRSEDLASDPRRDRALCATIRARLRDEPVVLAPTAATPPVRRRPWAVGGAIAAGVALVVGTFTVLRPGSDAPAQEVSQAERAPAAPVVVAASPPPDRQPADEAVVADMRLIRDAQLDRYFAAHKQFAGTSALGVPSAFLRSATVDTASR
jgi:sigma-E factor negative regulatory protein RseA